ncbi:protein YojO, partial [Escherichia coli]
MHTPIGVKPVAGSKEWREAWQKRAFAHISNGYKYIYIAINSPEIFL